MRISAETLHKVRDAELDFLRIESCKKRIPYVDSAHLILNTLRDETSNLKHEIRQLENMKALRNPGSILTLWKPSEEVERTQYLIGRLQDELDTKQQQLERAESAVAEKEKLQAELSVLLDTTVGGLLGPKEELLKRQKQLALASVNSALLDLNVFLKYKNSVDKSYTSLLNAFKCVEGISLFGFREEYKTMDRADAVKAYKEEAAQAEREFELAESLLDEIKKIDAQAESQLRKLSKVISHKRWLSYADNLSVSYVKTFGKYCQDDTFQLQSLMSMAEITYEKHNRSYLRLHQTFYRASVNLDRVRKQVFKKVLAELAQQQASFDTVNFENEPLQYPHYHSFTTPAPIFGTPTMTTSVLGASNGGGTKFGLATLRDLVEMENKQNEYPRRKSIGSSGWHTKNASSEVLDFKAIQRSHTSIDGSSRYSDDLSPKRSSLTSGTLTRDSPSPFMGSTGNYSETMSIQSSIIFNDLSSPIFFSDIPRNNSTGSSTRVGSTSSISDLDAREPTAMDQISKSRANHGRSYSRAPIQNVDELSRSLSFLKKDNFESF
ncbi:hypothetical protein HK098_005191 [Nowakowskiella sp. JEL0407]|nr:hypothetical protein HK098_005191 [Nowakowskiella sp. JEL0407]